MFFPSGIRYRGVWCFNVDWTTADSAGVRLPRLLFPRRPRSSENFQNSAPRTYTCRGTRNGRRINRQRNRERGRVYPVSTGNTTSPGPSGTMADHTDSEQPPGSPRVNATITEIPRVMLGSAREFVPINS